MATAKSQSELQLDFLKSILRLSSRDFTPSTRSLIRLPRREGGLRLASAERDRMGASVGSRFLTVQLVRHLVDVVDLPLPKLATSYLEDLATRSDETMPL